MNERVHELMPYVHQAQDKAAEWTQWLLTTQVSIASVLFLLLFIVLLFALECRRSKTQEGTMDHNRNSKQIVQYALGDTLLELQLNDHISIKDHDYWAHRIADEFDMPALRMRKRVKGRLAKYLKAQSDERRRLISRMNSKIPGPKPGEDLRTESISSSQLKSFFQKFA